MPLHYFRVDTADGGVTEFPAKIPDAASAWTETTLVFSDLAKSCARTLKENGEWRLELLDAFKQPMFRIRIVAEKI
jgi:hypothetical protein